MAKNNSRAYELLRRRNSLKRTRQVWVACLVIWGVVLGWVLWGFVNSITDNLDVLLGWVLIWLLPVLLLAVGSLVTHLRLRSCEADLLRAG